MNHSVARFRSSRHDILTMRKTILLTAIALAIVVFDAPASAQGLPTATPESVGLSSAQLDRVTAGLQAHIDQGHIAGVVAAVVRD